jgi:hypothetical protein
MLLVLMRQNGAGSSSQRAFAPHGCRVSATRAADAIVPQFYMSENGRIPVGCLVLFNTSRTRTVRSMGHAVNFFPARLFAIIEHD